MKTALFLGAGASVCVRLPTTIDLLKNLRGQHRNDEFITDVLKDEKFTDVEVVYDSVSEMINFANSSECRPLINMLEGKLDNKYRIVQKLGQLKSSIRDVVFSSLRIEPADVSEITSLYESLEETIRSHGDDKFKIITVNYDLAVETYCDHTGREVVDGFKKSEHSYKGYWSSKDGWKPKSSNPVYLFKLHGSLNWHKEYEDETTLVKVGDACNHASQYDLLIMPTQKAKKYDGGPFSIMMNRFENTLDEIDMLIVIGYSYRDEEINELIKKRLDTGLVVVSFSPSSSTGVKKLKVAQPPLILDSRKLDEIDKRKAKVYSYDTTFDQDTVGNICDILNRIYSHLNTVA